MTRARCRRTIPIVLFLIPVLVALSPAVARARSEAGASAPDGAWTTSGPAGGPVLALAADPRDPTRLFAGTSLGLYRSEDGGRSWSAAPTGPSAIFALAVAEAEPPQVFAGTGDGVARSLDGGDSFSSASLGVRITALAVNPADPSRIYAGGSSDVISESTNGGASWISHPIPDRTVRAIASLIVDPRDSSVLAGVAGFPADASYAYDYTAPPAFVGITGAGLTWRVFLPGGGPAQPVRVLARDPSSLDVIYAVKGDTIYVSSDGGATWTGPRSRVGSEVTSLIVDSSAPGTLYAGTSHGVFRSLDSGLHWAALPGLPPVGVLSLVIDSPRQILHAGTGRGVYEITLSALERPAPCAPAGDRLCLLRGRFQVQLEALDPRTARRTTGAAVAENDGFGYFSLPALTGDATLPEVVVKMLDASASPWQSFWVFYSGLTDVSYTLTVTDTLTGAVKGYGNDPNNPYCGGDDTAAFPASAAAAVVDPSTVRTLQASGATLALLSERFRLTLQARDPRTGRTAGGMAIATNDRFGFFSLPAFTGDPGLPEVFVKMLDATSLTGSFWLFQTGLTDLAYTLSVTDMTTGEVRRYASPGPLCGSADLELGR